MRKSKNILVFTLSAMAAILLAVSPAQAIIALPPSVSTHTLNGVNGSVDIGEFEIPRYEGFEAELPGILELGASGGYFVDVHDEASVFGFAVSINSHVYPYTNREGWNSAFISASEWDEGHFIGALFGLLTTDIGDFFSLFGEDDYVNLYYNVFGNNIVDTSDTDQPFPTDPSEAEFFFTGGFLASDFVAFTSTGAIIDQSRNLQPIPEPSTLLLLGTGMVGLIAHGLRKNSKTAV